MTKNTKDDLTAWIDLNNSEQCKWAFNYLVKQGRYLARKVRSPKDQAFILRCVREFKETLIDSPHNKHIMKQMLEAWDQKLYRQSCKKRNKNSYSFVIGTDFSKKLTSLAKRNQQARNATLEWLIEDAYSGVKNNRIILKEQKQMLKLVEQKARNEEWFNELFSYVSPVLLDRAEGQIKKLKEENDRLISELNSLKTNQSPDNKEQCTKQAVKKPVKKVMLSRHSEPLKMDGNERKTVKVEVRRKKKKID